MFNKIMKIVIIGFFASVLFNFSAQNQKTKFPKEITFPSSIGDVNFPHQMHVEDLEIECTQCHHQINAKKLETPHPQYFKYSLMTCLICHKENGGFTKQDFNCTDCHHPAPSNFADETLSAKVVIHKQCWQCHEIGRGVEASENCSFCHLQE